MIQTTTCLKNNNHNCNNNNNNNNNNSNNRNKNENDEKILTKKIYNDNGDDSNPNNDNEIRSAQAKPETMHLYVCGLNCCLSQSHFTHHLFLKSD